MAIDALGNYTGYDEYTGVDDAAAAEERRRREEELRRQQEARNQPVTQKITFNPDGTQKMTITGTPQALSSSQPNTPTVSGPVNPNDVFGRMQQVESGNRDFDAQGRPITSSAGAMYRNQVMPATAANPGYGIRPAANQSPEEYNRVGEEYYQAMLKQFGGDQQKAVAAYNAGPGRVQQNMQANAGQLNPQQLPKETQGYLQKVLGSALNAVIPSAQAGTVPQMNEQDRLRAAQAMPGSGSSYNPSAPAPAVATQPVQPVQPTTPGSAELAAAEGNTERLTAIVNGAYPENVKATARAQLQEQQRNQPPTPKTFDMRFTEASTDPMQLLSLHKDESLTPEQRTLAGKQAQQLLNQQLGEAKAKEDLGKMSELDMARLLRNKSEEGNWVKMLLLGFVSPTLAGKEANKLGLNDQWHSVMDSSGQPILFKTRNNLPIEGYNGQTGKQLNDNELVAASSQVGLKSADVSLTPHQAVVNGKLHTIETKRTPMGLMYRDATGGGDWTRTAPEGMTNIGQQDPGHLKGLSAMKTVMEKYRKDNLSIEQATGKPKYTEEQIQAAGNQAYQSVAGKPFAGAANTAAIPKDTTTVAPAPAATAANTPATTTAAAPVKGAKSLAQQILDYEAPPPPPSARDAGSVALRNEVNSLAAEQGKAYNAGNFKLVTGFNNSQSGKALKSINVAVDHLDTLQEAANELKNGQTPAFNKIANLYATNTGQTAPGNFDALKSIVGAEVAKAVVGGASALGDREEIRKEIDNAKNPEQLAGVIKKFQQLMAGQAKGIRQEWVSSGLDEAAFDAKLMPRTKVVLNQQKEPTRSKW